MKNLKSDVIEPSYMQCPNLTEPDLIFTMICNIIMYYRCLNRFTESIIKTSLAVGTLSLSGLECGAEGKYIIFSCNETHSIGLIILSLLKDPCIEPPNVMFCRFPSNLCVMPTFL